MDDADGIILAIFGTIVFLLIFLGIREVVIRSIKKVPEFDRTAYSKMLKKQRKHMKELEEIHDDMVDLQKSRIQDAAEMRDNTSYVIEDWKAVLETNVTGIAKDRSVSESVITESNIMDNSDKVKDIQTMRSNVGTSPEDLQRKQKDFMRDQRQRMKDMQRMSR